MSVIEAIGVEINRRFGLVLRDDWQDDLSRAARVAAKRLGASGEEILERAIWDGRMLTELAGRLTVPESSFFRNVEQLTRVSRFAATRASDPTLRGPVRIWSAGCSRGEEPYSVAILLEELLPSGARSEVEIVATDLSLEAIEAAELGVYSPWALRAVPDVQRQAYFRRGLKDHLVLNPEIRSQVTFTWRPIQDFLGTVAPDWFDVILFRNVAIYMTRETIASLYRRFATILKPEGLLCLGASDPAPSDDRLLRQLGMPIFAKHARDVHARVCSPAASESARPLHVHASGLLCGTQCAEPAFPCRLSGVVDEVETRATQEVEPAAPSEHSPAPVSSPDRLLMRLRRGLVLADNGAKREALAIAEELIVEESGAKHGYLLRGQVFLSEERLKEAKADLRRAAFLDPTDHLARFWYALALQGAGSHKRARAGLTALVVELRQEDRTTVVTDGQTTVAELLRAVQLALEFLP